MSLKAMEDNEKDLVPATDEEIAATLEEVLDEMAEDIRKGLEEYDPEAEAYGREFAAAKTVEERTAVMKKYKVGQYRDGAEGVFII